MPAHPRKRTATARCSRLARLLLSVTLSAMLPLLTSASDGGTDAGRNGETVRISLGKPTCDQTDALPVIPNDPGTRVTSTRRCYGTRAPELELWLPTGKYVWLDQRQPLPSAWVVVGPLLIDTDDLDAAPLGLKLQAAEDGWTLETRRGGLATLSRVQPRTWNPVTAADGTSFWLRVGNIAGDATPTRQVIDGGGRRYRTH